MNIIRARPLQALAASLAVLGIGMAVPATAVCQVGTQSDLPRAIAEDLQLTAAPAGSEAATSKPSPFGPAVGLQRLTGSRGGANTTSTQVDIGGVLKDSTATNVSTGNNAIRDGSFANAVGFNTVIQNSGANVLIQNSMTVNVQFK